LGWLSLSQPSPDDTNTRFLTQSLLAPQLGQCIPVWHCPSDKSTSLQGGRKLPCVRTVSMNGWLNCEQSFDSILGFHNGGKIIYRTSDMVNPGPSDTFVFTDERADSINDGYFAQPMWPTNQLAEIGDWPGSYHSGAGTFSFADSHAELHKWVDPRTKP